MFHLQNRLKSQHASRTMQSVPSVPQVQIPAVSTSTPKVVHRPVTRRTAREPESTAETRKQNILIQILCQDASSKQQAINRFAKYSWARILLLNEEWQHSGLQENSMQLQQLPQNEDEWNAVDFVGTISQKAPQKIDLTRFINVMETGLISGKPLENQDAIFFFCARISFESSVRGHPNFMRIWNDAIANQCMIGSKETAFCNFWMARPCCMTNQINQFKTDLWPSLQAHPLTMTDARQKSTHTKESVQRCNGKPQQTHVPFILERVPRNFFKDFGYLYTCM